MGRHHRHIYLLVIVGLAWVAFLLVRLPASAIPSSTNPDWPAWGGTQPTAISTGLPDYGLQPALAADPSGLMVAVWSNPPTEGALRNIYSAISYDNGITWSSPTCISQTARHSYLPDVAIAGDTIFVAWTEGLPPYAVYVAERPINGDWSAVRSIPVPPSVPVSGFTRARLAANATHVHVVFSAGDPQQDILYAVSPLTGTVRPIAAWPAATVIYTHTSTSSMRNPALALDPEGNVHLVWEKYNSLNDREVLYMYGRLEGEKVSWSTPVELSAGINRPVWPAIAAEHDGKLHVAWGEEIGTTDKPESHYVRYTYYDGSTWSTPERISSSPVKINHESPAYIAPDIALLEGRGQTEVCIAFQGYSSGSDIHAEEVLVSCTTAGSPWPPLQNVSRSPEYEKTLSILPSIAFDGRGKLHVVWQELAGEDLIENYAIYHSRALDRAFLPLVARGG